MSPLGIAPNLADAIELLTRKWNPPHRPPRPIRLSATDATLTLPPGVPLSSLRGAYLRGLALDHVTAERDCLWSDLRGADIGIAQPALKDARFTLRARVRARPSTALLPQLRTWLSAGAQGHSGAVRTLAFSRDGLRLASGGDDGSVRLWLRSPDGSARQTAALKADCGAVECLAFKRDSTQLACGGSDGSIHRWLLGPDGSAHSLGQFGAHRVVEGSEAKVTGVAFPNTDDNLLASVGADGGLRLWRPDAEGRGGGPGFIAHPELYGIAGLASSRDGASLATATGDGFVVLWHLASGKVEERFRFRADERAVNCLAINEEGTQIVTGGTDTTVRLWALGPSAASEIARSAAAQAGIASVALGSRGRIASADLMSGIQLWRFGTSGELELTGSLAAHEGRVHQLAFNRDETQLASAGADGTIRLWALLSNASARETASLKSVALEFRRRLAGAPPPTPGEGADPRLLLVDGDDAQQIDTFERSDGLPFETELVDGQVVCADRLLHEGLCFGDPEWGYVPVFEVPPGWLQWSDECRRVTISSAIHPREELRDWADAAPA